jgi:hypothetical protein
MNFNLLYEGLANISQHIKPKAVINESDNNSSSSLNSTKAPLKSIYAGY